MMNMELLMQYVTLALIAVGALAFVVAVIVQVIKEQPWLMKVQTSVVALVVSVLLCVFVMAVACQCFKIAIIWYYWPGAVIAAFIVYLVATGGWERISSIWQRTKYNRKNITENE